MSQVCAKYACEAVTQTDLKKLKKLCAYKFLVAREGADWRVCVVWGLQLDDGWVGSQIDGRMDGSDGWMHMGVRRQMDGWVGVCVWNFNVCVTQTCLGQSTQSPRRCTRSS